MNIVPHPQGVLHRNCVVAIYDVCQEDVMYSSHHRHCIMLQLFPQGGDYNTHEVVNVDLQSIVTVVGPP